MAVDLLLEGGRMIVSPTKVGDIIMTTDIGGLTRMFSFEEASSQQARRRAVPVDGAASAAPGPERRNRRVLSARLGQRHSAGLHFTLESRRQGTHPHDGSEPLMMDQRSTSCFVIKFGAPSELITHALWEDHGALAFASSANPSGKGNSGRVDGIGERINDEADLVIAADDYVRGIQPSANVKTATNKGSWRQWSVPTAG
ncbi:translation factor (SUA5) [Bradyrhizobium sp. CB1650]|uniref:translation factor (SUA5) n=1 Tax=Bradyrhizobium sp. CB1650 TaxID=3039153 RepID=UPI0024352662|nr:translation factor (SUA5) [Bradyrhizobium sp. CB1650]WGD50114.1 translation factor (SUA5) [Bradyrhizobium sp. CB1650]